MAAAPDSRGPGSLASVAAAFGEDWDDQLPPLVGNVRGGLGSLAARFNTSAFGDAADSSHSRFPGGGGAGGDSSYSASSPDVPISPDNAGFRLLRQMGWTEGSGLGRNRQGRKEPVRLVCVVGRGGLGVEREYDEQSKAATASRQLLASEVQLQETPEQTLQRLERARLQQQQKEAVALQNTIFNCKICAKTYARADQWEEHLSSYDHHHRKRMQETLQQEAARRGAARNASSALTKRLEEEMLQSQMAAAQAASADSQQPAEAAVAVQSSVLDASVPRQSVKLTFGAKPALRGKKPFGRR